MSALKTSEILVWPHLNDLANLHAQFISGIAYGNLFFDSDVLRHGEHQNKNCFTSG